MARILRREEEGQAMAEKSRRQTRTDPPLLTTQLKTIEAVIWSNI
jgi:hypothetical protein